MGLCDDLAVGDGGDGNSGRETQEEGTYVYM